MTDGVGRVAVVLRHPSRAVRLASALRSAGVAPFALPLTDTELPADIKAVAAELDALRRGDREWLVVTSGNTVRALDIVARGAGMTLAEVVRSGRVMVAAVGAATARLLTERGIAVDLVPERSSSEGLLEVFGPGAGSVLLPQGNLAPDDLSRGLREQGWSVHRVVAYCTVPYPADVVRAVPVDSEDGVPPPLIGTTDVHTLGMGRVPPAVVFLAPSAVRQFRERLGGQVAFLPVAIGGTTAEALLSEGWRPASVASDPSPDGVTHAVLDAFTSAPEPLDPSARPFDPAPGDRS